MSRKPLFDEGMERVLLGCLMASAEVIDDVSGKITEETFYNPRHAAIYRAIIAAHADGAPVEPNAVAARLAGTGDLPRVGGAPVLLELLQQAPIPAQAPWYADELANLALLRAIEVIGGHATQYAYEVDRANPTAAVDRLQAELDALSVRPDADDPVPWADLIDPGFDSMESAAAEDGGPRGIPTGFADLDRLIGGLKPGHLVVVAARTSIGKSVLSRGLLRNAAFRHKVPSVLFTQEMTRGEVFRAILSAELRIPLHVIDEGKMSDAEWTEAARFVADTVDVPLWVDDTASIGLAEIRAKCRRMQQRHGLGLVVVDYLQLLDTGRGENRQVAVSALSRGLKILAGQLGCPVVAVSQLNRGPEMRQDKRPQLADLRESGAIENDANMVILIHREDFYDRESARRGEADFIVAKNRGGPLDTVTVAAQLHFSRFIDMSI